ncbi:hypothetical protein CCO02nite_19010 [Cellulomonas composti]|uniref:Uncharacterized protein n=1 Tax=Cellulomonas composti TaxID=266130 RepID=A0A511JC03_9CELL|nr:hypothetical protein CCO02nite_19010 [Cellulomonas composti]
MRDEPDEPDGTDRPDESDGPDGPGVLGAAGTVRGGRRRVVFFTGFPLPRAADADYRLRS